MRRTTDNNKLPSSPAPSMGLKVIKSREVPDNILQCYMPLPEGANKWDALVPLLMNAYERGGL